MPLSAKQVELRQSIRDRRWIIATGPIRSAKTSTALSRFLEWADQHHSNKYFAVCTHTDSQFKNVILPEAEKWLGDIVPLKRRDSYYEFGSGNKLLKFIGNNVGSTAKIRGFTLSGLFVDEYAKQPQEFVGEAIGRCSDPDGVKIIFTCNPEGPLHWAKTDYIDRADELGIKVVQFSLDDNPILDEDFKNSIKSTFTGVMYKRLIDGEWAAATGAIYPFVQDVITKPPENEIAPWKLNAAIDVASATVTHVLLIGHFSKGRYWVIDEWRHDGSTEGQLRVDQQINAIIRWLGGRRPSLWVMDPSANDFQLNMAQVFGADRIQHGINDVIPGIQSVNMAMAYGRLKIDPKCKHLIREMANYMWDEKAAEKTIDKPLKQNDHGADALRYYVHTTQMRDLIRPRFTRVRRG